MIEEFEDSTSDESISRGRISKEQSEGSDDSDKDSVISQKSIESQESLRVRSLRRTNKRLLR